MLSQFLVSDPERNREPNEKVIFRAGIGEEPAEVKRRLLKLFEGVKDDYFDIFGETDTIQLDPDSLVYVIGDLQTFAITEADRDVIGDAFEVFIDSTNDGRNTKPFITGIYIRSSLG